MEWITIAIVVLVVVAILIPISIRQNKFKKTIIADTIKEIFPDAVYEPSKYITKDEYKEIGCLRRGSFYRGNDLLEAKTKGGTPFRYCKIYTYDHVNKTDVTVFKGGIFSFKYPKKFQSRVYLVSKKGWGKGAFKSEFTKTDKIEMENAEFNDTYRIYTEDEQTAFYIFTPQVMEKFIEYKKNENNAIIVSFKDNWMHIAISNLNLFKVPLMGSRSKKKIEKFVAKTKSDLGKITDIVDNFKLDSRLFDTEQKD